MSNFININQFTQDGKNIIPINMIDNKKTIDIIHEYKISSKKNNFIPKNYLSQNTDKFIKHIENNTITKKINLNEHDDVHLDEYYVPLAISPDLESLRNLRQSTSRADFNELSNDQHLIERIRNSNGNISSVDVAYLKFKAFEHEKSIKKTTQNSIVDDPKEYLIDDKFIIEDYFQKVEKKIINIQAGAGHGKTTILRKILLNQSNANGKKPLFISLKNITKSLFALIIETFRELDPELTENQILSILDSGNIIIILDGFDEINEKLVDKPNIIKEIKVISESLTTPILISSRPNPQLINTSGIAISGLKDLNDDQLKNIFNKLNKHKLFDEALLNGFMKNPARKAIKTPLLANLFIRTYPHLSTFPENSRDFYKNIFDVLHSGHDSFKGGQTIYRRLHELMSKESSKEYFSLLSATSLALDKDHLTADKYSIFLQKIIEYFNINTPTEETNEIFSKNYIESLIECTSLLVEDGNDGLSPTYTYLHRSILEYYAATFFQTNIYGSCQNSFNKSITSKISESILSGESKYIDFCKNLCFINRNLYFNQIVKPIIEKLKLHDKSNEIVKELAKLLLQNINIKSINETRLETNNKHIKTFHRISLMEIANIKIEHDSLLSTIINLATKKQTEEINNLTNKIADEIGFLLISKHKTDQTKLSKITNNKPYFFIQNFKYKDLEEINFLDNQNILKLITETYEKLVEITQDKFKETKPLDISLSDFLESF